MVNFSDWDYIENRSRFYLSILLDEDNYVDVSLLEIFPYEIDDMGNNAVLHKNKDNYSNLSYDINKEYTTDVDGESIEIIILIGDSYPTKDDITISNAVKKGLIQIIGELMKRGYNYNTANTMVMTSYELFLNRTFG